MNAIAPPSGRRTEQSQALAQAIAAEMSRPPAHPEAGPEPRQLVAPHVAAEAAQAVIAAQAGMAAPSPSQIEAWVEPLIFVCRNPPTTRDLLLWCQGVAFAAERIPARAFSRQALQELMGKSHFFPSAADVLEVVRPAANRMAAELRALRAIAASPAPAAKAPPVSPEQRAADEARTAAMVLEAQSRAVSGAMREREINVKPSFFTPFQLMVACRNQIREGGPNAFLARTRLDILERKNPEMIAQIDRLETAEAERKARAEMARR
jgi:hypothetical protein